MRSLYKVDFIDIRLKIISINDISITRVIHTWSYMYGFCMYLLIDNDVFISNDVNVRYV